MDKKQASFNDFIISSAKEGKKDVSYRVNDIIKAQASPGVSADNDDRKGRLKDIAEMFVSADRSVEEESKTFSSKEVLDELMKVNKNFGRYADNINNIKFLLKKFQDESSEFNEEDLSKLQDLISENKSLVDSVNKQRKEDKEFNAKLEGIEKENEFNFRSNGLMQEEQMRIQKKYNVSEESLWNSISDNIEGLKEEVKSDFKTMAFEELGGPLGSMITKSIIPGLKAIRDTKLGQALGDKLSDFSNRVKGALITKSNEDNSSVVELDTQAQSFNQKDENVPVNNDVSLDNIDVKDKRPVGRPKKDVDIVKAITTPTQASIKRRVLMEESAKKNRRNSEPIFSEIKEIGEKGNVLLSDILSTLKSDLHDIDTVVTSLAETKILSDSIKSLSSNEISELNSNTNKQKEFLKEIRDNSELQVAKSEIVKDLFGDQFNDQKQENVETGEFNEYTEVKLKQILDAIKKSDGGGGDSLSGDILGETIGNALGKFLPGLLGTIAKTLGVIGLAAGAGALIWKGLDTLKGKEDLRLKGADFIKKQAYKNLGAKSVEDAVAEEDAFRKKYKLEDKAGAERYEFYTLPENTVKGMKPEQRKMYEEGQAIKEKKNKALSEVILKNFKVGITKEGTPIVDYDKLVNSGLLTSEKEILNYANSSKVALQAGDEIKDFTKGHLDNLNGLNKVLGVDVDEKFEEKAIEIGKAIEQNAKVEEQVKSMDGAMIQESPLKPQAYEVPVKEMQSTPSVNESKIDKSIREVTKETSELKAKIETNNISESKPTAMVQPIVVGGGSGSNKSKDQRTRFDEISILPQDNFGLILVNSGLNII